jgi:hypothetical protein
VMVIQIEVLVWCHDVPPCTIPKLTEVDQEAQGNLSAESGSRPAPESGPVSSRERLVEPFMTIALEFRPHPPTCEPAVRRSLFLPP